MLFRSVRISSGTIAPSPILLSVAATIAITFAFTSSLTSAFIAPITAAAPAISTFIPGILVGVFKEYPDTNLLVVGHTDSQGSEEYNMTLSKNRAYAVTNYVIQKGISQSRLTTNWFGESQPLHDNNTAEGRAKNRRVNIAILPNEKMIQDAKTQAGN